MSDFKRILLGQNPAYFLFECVGRTVVIYVLLLVATRFLGKRMSGQVSIVEVAVMLTLGAIVSVPMQVATKGILPATVVLICVVCLQRTLNRMGFRRPRIDEAIHGRETMLVKDCRLHLDGLDQAVISHEQVFALLRSQGVYHLGQVKRAYLEAKGGLGIFLDPKPQPGLPVLPVEDARLIERLPHYGFACLNCGEVSDVSDVDCPRCQAHRWTRAVASDE